MAADVDIDLADRSKLLELIRHVPAQKLHQGKKERHQSGVYIQPIPYDPSIGASALHYEEAERRGYFKLDLLNVHVYQHIRDQAHYDQLMAIEPPWHRLQEEDFVRKIIHISNYPAEVAAAEINSIPHMAMFLAAIRPSKRYLLGLSWKEMSKTIWRPVPGEYTFKKAHAVSYAVLVGLHMNIIQHA